MNESRQAKGKMGRERVWWPLFLSRRCAQFTQAHGRAESRSPRAGLGLCGWPVSCELPRHRSHWANAFSGWHKPILNALFLWRGKRR